MLRLHIGKASTTLSLLVLACFCLLLGSCSRAGFPDDLDGDAGDAQDGLVEDGDAGEDAGDDEDAGDAGEDAGDAGEDAGDAGEDAGDAGEDVGDEDALDGGPEDGDAGQDSDPGDLDPPVRYDAYPLGELPTGTTAVTMGLNTDEAASCRYSDVPGTDYDSMTGEFATGDGRAHAADLGGLSDGVEYLYLVRCRDTAGNTNPDDLEIRFSVADKPVVLYRSVGPGQTGALSSGAGLVTLEIQGGQASFSSSQPDQIGVGDMIQYDPAGGLELGAIAVITERHTPISYSVSSPDGQPAVETQASGLFWFIHRAYSSLYGAASRTPNPGIDAGLSDFDDFLEPSPDLVTQNARLEVACYKGQDHSNPVDFSGWATDEDHGIHVFTPVSGSQVGVSQRHFGVWDSGGYVFLENYTGTGITLSTGFIHLEGLQINVYQVGTNDSLSGILVQNLPAGGLVRISSTLFTFQFGNGAVSGPFVGLQTQNNDDTAEIQIWNNLFFEFQGLDSGVTTALVHESGKLLAFNNTFAASDTCLQKTSGSAVARNNLFADCYSSPASGVFLAGTDFNATNNWSLGYTVTGGGNLNDRTWQDFTFFNSGVDDYHLDDLDQGALDHGVNFVQDLFTNDFDGQERTVPWDIGADEFN